MLTTNKDMDITVLPGAPGLVLFWGGPLSQWYPEYNEATALPAQFTIDGQVYDRAEKWMMAEKARCFGDAEQLRNILASDSPLDIKAFGRRVQGFDPVQWGDVCRDVVYRGTLAKFEQNAELRALLLATEDALIAEASPEDSIWGIGLAVADPRAADPKLWLGTNWLGEALMRARETIRSGAAT